MKRILGAVSIVATLVASSPAAAAPRYSDWSEPVYVAATNTSDLDFPNAISRDGLSLYFQRGTAATSGEDLYVVHRESVDGPWSAPIKLPATVNSAANDRGAFVSIDGHWLYFASNRTGGFGDFDMYVSWRAHVHDDQAWESAVNLAAVNTTGFDSGPALFEDEEAGTTDLYMASNPAGGQALADIYVSRQNADGSFGSPALVTALNSAGSEGRPYLSRDGLEIYLQSNRTGGQGGFDIWSSTRATTRDGWSAPVNVAGINTIGQDVTPALSWDDLTLFIGSTRATGGGDIFVSQREKERGKP